MSLRFRFNLIITLLVTVLTAALAGIVILDARRSIQEELNAGGKVISQLLGSVLHNLTMSQPDSVDDELLDFLQNLGRVRAHEIHYYDANGWLVYTSPPASYKWGRDAPAWFSHLVAPELSPTEFDALHGRIVVTPDASRAVLDAWDDLTKLLWIVLGFLLAVNTVVFFLVGRFLRPLESIVKTLSTLEGGNFNPRLPHFPVPEFESISATVNRISGELERSEAENRRLALIAQQSSDAIFVRDLDGTISYWNPAAERMFGYAATEIIGRSGEMLVPPERRHEPSARLEALRERRVIENVETQRTARDTRLVDVALSASPLVDPATDTVIGQICGMRDITEFKRARQAEMELEQNRRLTHLIQSRLEQERRTLARELHDELGQCVTAIRTIGTAIAQQTRAIPEVHEKASTIVDVAGHLYDLVHGIIRQLRPPALDNLGLREALEDWLAGWREHNPQIACRLTLRGDLDDLGETINITIYRVVQECMTNVVRHAAASAVEIVVSRGAGEVELSVSDNGRGLTEPGEGPVMRFGLMGMRERVQALAGRFELRSEPGLGLTVSASIPLRARSAECTETARHTESA